MYELPIIAYLFLGGTAAGSFCTMSLWSIAYSCQLRRRTQKETALTSSYRNDCAFNTIQSRVYLISFLLLILSVLFLFWDLGVPEKVLYIFTRPHFTVLTFGTVCLMAETVIGALLTAESIFHLRALRNPSKTIFPAICIATSLATMAYTGVFLMGSIGIPLWSSWTIVPLFVMSSLSCGISLALLVGYMVKSDEILLQASRFLGKCHLVALVLESLCITLFLLAALDNPATIRSWELLMAPDMLPIAVIGVCGLGIAIPILDEIYSVFQRNRCSSPIANAMCLCGGFLLRFCIIMCGAYG